MRPFRDTDFRVLFIVFAIAVTLAHVCVLPGHAHVSPVVTEGHEHDEPAHHGDAAPEDSVYAESCDALRPASPVPVPPMLMAMVTVVPAVPMSFRAPEHGAGAMAPSASPPLYLVHRALLI